jgi:hypothetical protein
MAKAGPGPSDPGGRSPRGYRGSFLSAEATAAGPLLCFRRSRGESGQGSRRGAGESGGESGGSRESGHPGFLPGLAGRKPGCPLCPPCPCAPLCPRKPGCPLCSLCGPLVAIHVEEGDLFAREDHGVVILLLLRKARQVILSSGRGRRLVTFTVFRVGNLKCHPYHSNVAAEEFLLFPAFSLDFLFPTLSTLPQSLSRRDYRKHRIRTSGRKWPGL